MSETELRGNIIQGAAATRRTTAGKTWWRKLYRDDRTGAVDLSMDAANPDVLYAGVWEVFRTPHSLSMGGAGATFKQLAGRLGEEQRRLDSVVARELTAFNEQLRGARLEPVKDAAPNPAPPSPPQRQEALPPPRTARPLSPSTR